MRISFRTRQFAHGASAMIVVLAVVTSVGWSRIMAFEDERLDDRLCIEARRLAGPLRPDDSANRLLADVALKLRLDTANPLMMQSLAREGVVRLQSSQWEPSLASEAMAWSAPSGPPKPGARPGADPRGECEFGALESGGRSWRATRVQGPVGSAILAAELRAAHAEMQGALARALILVVPLALALAALGAWLLASLSLRPVIRLRDAMRQVTPQALDQRLLDRGEDHEFRELLEAYNTMLARLEVSFEHASRFSADAAHELKTPLTILQGQLEQAMAQSTGTALQAELGVMLDEVGRLGGITRKLLLLSQADAGRLSLQKQRVDLSTLLGEMVEDLQMMLQGQTLAHEIEPGLIVNGDEVLLRQMLNNLVSNAARHGIPDGWMRLAAWSRDGRVQVTVANASMPLGPERRERFFQRFYRADASRGRKVDGTGLGLSLAREIARAHGGDLVLEPSAEDVVRLTAQLPQG